MQKTSKVKDQAGVTIGRPKPSTAWKEVDINRVCFRGDTRAPLVGNYKLLDWEQELLAKAKKNKDKEYLINFDLNHPEIFKEGFKVQSNENVTPAYRNNKPNEKIGDIENSTAVCVSTDFYTTPFFPLSSHTTPTKPMKQKDIWSYAVFVERGYNTNMKQVFQGQSIMEKKTKELYLDVAGGKKKSLTEQEAAQINWALFGQELAVRDSIPVRNIIAAVKIVDRIENKGGGFDNGVSFRAEELVVNPEFRPETLDEATAKKYFDDTVRFLLAEIATPTVTVTPNQHSGIHKLVTSHEDIIKAEIAANKKAENAVHKKSIDLDVYNSPDGRSVTEAINELIGAVRELTDKVITLQKSNDRLTPARQTFSGPAKNTGKNEEFWT